MSEVQVEMEVPQLSKFAGELDEVIKYIGKNIQVITQSINVVRKDEEKIFYTYIPEIIRKQDEIMKKQEVLETGMKDLSRKMETVDKKVNDLAIQTNEILTKLLPLIEGIKNSQQRAAQITTITPVTAAMPNKLVNTKYCKEEISDAELDALDMEQLKHLRQNIASTKYKYNKNGKTDYVTMCDRNTEKINSRLKIST